MTEFLQFHSKEFVYNARFNLPAAASLKVAHLDFVILPCFILTISNALDERD